MSKHTTPQPLAATITTSPAHEPLLKSRDIARMLNCTSRNIELMADRGQIKRITIGPRCHRFIWSNVAQALGI